MKKIFSSIYFVFAQVWNNPIIVIPFLLLALFQGMGLYLVYLSPQYPVSILLGPPVRAFFGEKFLHYPLNFIVLPKIYSYVINTVNFFPGILLNALQILIIDSLYNKKSMHLWQMLGLCIKKIHLLILFWLINYYCNYFSFKYSYSLLLFLNRFLSPYLSPLNPLINNHPKFYILFASGISFLCQILFLYALPLILLHNKNFYLSMKDNFKMLYRLFFPSVFLFSCGAIFFIPVLFIKTRILFFMQQYFPEIALSILGVEILIMFILNYVLTTSTTYLYLTVTGNNKNDSQSS
jgi:hypothetical protein